MAVIILVEVQVDISIVNQYILRVQQVDNREQVKINISHLLPNISLQYLNIHSAVNHNRKFLLFLKVGASFQKKKEKNGKNMKIISNVNLNKQAVNKQMI